MQHENDSPLNSTQIVKSTRLIRGACTDELTHAPSNARTQEERRVQDIDRGRCHHHLFRSLLFSCSVLVFFLRGSILPLSLLRLFCFANVRRRRRRRWLSWQLATQTRRVLLLVSALPGGFVLFATLRFITSLRLRLSYATTVTFVLRTGSYRCGCWSNRMSSLTTHSVTQDDFFFFYIKKKESLSS